MYVYMLLASTMMRELYPDRRQKRKGYILSDTCCRVTPLFSAHTYPKP